MRSATSGLSHGLSGSVEQISWRWGLFGRSTPSRRAISGDHAPQAFTTLRVAIRWIGASPESPRFRTRTPSIREPRVSMPTTSVNVAISTPSFVAACAKPQTNGHGKTTPSSGL